MMNDKGELLRFIQTLPKTNIEPFLENEKKLLKEREDFHKAAKALKAENSPCGCFSFFFTKLFPPVPKTEEKILPKSPQNYRSMRI